MMVSGSSGAAENSDGRFSTTKASRSRYFWSSSSSDPARKSADARRSAMNALRSPSNAHSSFTRSISPRMRSTSASPIAWISSAVRAVLVWNRRHCS